MASRVKSFRPAPDYDLNAPRAKGLGALPLGSIIPAKDKPKRCLNRKGRVTIDAGDVFSNKKKEFKVTSQQIKQRSVGVWTDFLSNVGLPASLSVAGESHSSQEYVIACDWIETQWFQPDHQYIFKSLQDESVAAFGRHRLWVDPVYMVTGVKIARGVVMESVERSGTAGQASATLNVTAATGVSGSLGAGAAAQQQSLEAVEWEESEDFVFAYSLIKIKRKRDGTFTEEDVEKGNLFSNQGAPMPDETAENVGDIWDLASDTEDGAIAETLVPDLKEEEEAAGGEQTMNAT